MQIRARHYATGETVDITFDDHLIIAVAPAGAGTSVSRWVAPALFDLQINGGKGISFNSEYLTIDGVRQVVDLCQRHGIGGFCATLVTNSVPALTHGMSTVRRARDVDKVIAKAIPAIHLEGPYISPEDGPRGAHPIQHVRAPDWDEFQRLQDAAGGLIRMVTLAPELPGAIAFIEKLTKSDIVAAIGHTSASANVIRDAVSAGVRVSTHLGNASHAVLPRHENYVWEQLANDDLWATVIADGHHLPPGVVKCILRVKTPARTILISDLSPLAGLSPGIYREWEQDFEVKADGRIVIPNTEFLAGSSMFTDTCVANVIQFAGVSLCDAVDMASTRPRELLGLAPRRLQPGEPADFAIFEQSESGVFSLADAEATENAV